MLMGTCATYPTDHNPAVVQATGGLFQPPLAWCQIYMPRLSQRQGVKSDFSSSHRPTTPTHGETRDCSLSAGLCSVLVWEQGMDKRLHPAEPPSNVPWRWESGAGHACLHAHASSPAVGQWTTVVSGQGVKRRKASPAPGV